LLIGIWKAINYEKQEKIGFITSVVLNILLVTSLVLSRNYVKGTDFELAEMNAKAEANLAKSILKTLDTGNPNDIKQLKEILGIIANQGENTAHVWKSAARK